MSIWINRPLNLRAKRERVPVSLLFEAQLRRRAAPRSHAARARARVPSRTRAYPNRTESLRLFLSLLIEQPIDSVAPSSLLPLAPSAPEPEPSRQLLGNIQRKALRFALRLGGSAARDSLPDPVAVRLSGEAVRNVPRKDPHRGRQRSWPRGQGHHGVRRIDSAAGPRARRVRRTVGAFNSGFAACSHRPHSPSRSSRLHPPPPSSSSVSASPFSARACLLFLPLSSFLLPPPPPPPFPAPHPPPPPPPLTRSALSARRT